MCEPRVYVQAVGTAVAGALCSGADHHAAARQGGGEGREDSASALTVEATLDITVKQVGG